MSDPNKPRKPHPRQKAGKAVQAAARATQPQVKVPQPQGPPPVKTPKQPEPAQVPVAPPKELARRTLPEKPEVLRDGGLFGMTVDWDHEKQQTYDRRKTPVEYMQDHMYDANNMLLGGPPPGPPPTSARNAMTFIARAARQRAEDPTSEPSAALERKKLQQEFMASEFYTNKKKRLSRDPFADFLANRRLQHQMAVQKRADFEQQHAEKLIVARTALYKAGMANVDKELARIQKLYEADKLQTEQYNRLVEQQNAIRDRMMWRMDQEMRQDQAAEEREWGKEGYRFKLQERGFAHEEKMAGTKEPPYFPTRDPLHRQLEAARKELDELERMTLSSSINTTVDRGKLGKAIVAKRRKVMRLEREYEASRADQPEEDPNDRAGIRGNL